MPRWHDNLTTGEKTPARMIRLDLLPHQSLEKPFGPHNYILNGSIPIAVLLLNCLSFFRAVLENSDIGAAMTAFEKHRTGKGH